MKYFDEKLVVKYDNNALLNWLKNEAGVQSEYFMSKTLGNLQLQQIPEEYVRLLDFLRNSDIESYLELGIANGGSFLTNCLFIGEKCKKFHAVDSLQYGELIKQTSDVIDEKMDILKNAIPDSECLFFNSYTDDFFVNNKETYDCIFIDADHSYEGVKKDYENSIKILNKNGFLIFHDIGNTTVGVRRLWEEIRSKASKVEEYLIHPNSCCGIGIYFK